MRKCILLLFIITATNLFAQDSLLIGKKYFEDQIYGGFTNNFFVNKPNDLLQKGISTGLQVGFIKDIPINKQGSFALGLGIGYAYNRYNQNIKIQSELPELSLIETQYSSNRLSTYSIEIPFEFRFRLTSSPTIYKFWRIYVGGKLAYTFHSNAVYKDDNGSFKTNPNIYLAKWSYGPQIAVGYSAFNMYIYYPLKPLFKDSQIVNTAGVSELKRINVGLQFYIF